MGNKITRSICGLLAALTMLGSATAYGELDVGGERDVVNGAGLSEATVSAAAAVFRIIVPTKLPFAILADDTVLTASNAGIKNESNGPVEITGITVEAGSWGIAEFGTDFSKVPVNSKLFTMKLNNDVVPAVKQDAQTNVPITNADWNPIYGRSIRPIVYDGAFAPQSSASAEAVIAHVIFAVSWQMSDESAEEPVTELLYTYEIKDDQVEITGLNETGKSRLTITQMPGTIEGLPVTSIRCNSFANCKNLALTRLPESITVINEAAFMNCENLCLTQLPSKLTVIKDMSFFGCTSLALSSLPDGVTTIRPAAFQGCSRLALTSLPDTLKVIMANVFFNCTNLAVDKLPDSLEQIGQRSFSNCPNITISSIPSSVTMIDGAAFQYSKNVNVTSVPCEYETVAFQGTMCETPVENG